MLKKLLGAPRDLLLRSFDGILGGDEWRPLLDFVSPTFFDVVPMRAMLGQGRELVTNAADASSRAAAEQAVADALSRRGIAVRISRDPTGDPVASDPGQRGQRVLAVFFAQLFGSETTLIDLRAGAFTERGGATAWSPGPYFVRWDREFLDGLRVLYRGYYADDERAFDAGLGALDLVGCKDLFRRHFGDDPSAVRFDRAHFVATFHDVFVRCRDSGVRLHRNFLPLGITLAALHENLGGLGGGPFDVRAAFEEGAG